MKTDKNIREEVEKTLQSLDTMANLEGNPFLFTRIESRMGSLINEEAAIFSFRSAVMPVTLVLILLFNILTALSYFESTSFEDVDQTLISALRSDYQIIGTQDEFLKGE